MPQLPLNPYHNQQLFSDYFLAELLPQRAEWRALVPAAAALLPQIAALYSPDLAKGNEAQLEIVWVQPILRLLGHTFEVQAALKTPDGTKKPDYVLYRDEAAVIAHRGETLSDARLAAVQALAVGDAKAWGRSLDMTLKGSGDPFSNKNPSYQIAFYIQHSGLDWGILTKRLLNK